MKKTITMMVLLCVVAFAQEKGTFTDPRDKKTYKTVKIGKQTWMAENLNFNAEGSKCYNNEEENCQKYGRLYNWNTAMKVCPKGWHLPSKDEWQTLVDFAGGNEIAGKKLKTSSGWKEVDKEMNNGDDTFGFAALPGGGCYSSGNFVYVENRGNWWSATKYYTDDAYSWLMYSYKENFYPDDYDKYKILFSVRCLQN